MKINILSLLLSIFILIGCSKDELINETENPTSGNPVIQQIFDGQVLSSFNIMDIFKIIKKEDGLIFITYELISEATLNTGIRISKTDNQLNIIWTFLIDKSSDSEEFAGVLELSNNEYIAILKKFSTTNTGLYNNEVYGIKFNGSGTILWEKDYSINNMDVNTHFDLPIKFTNNSNDLKVMFRSDSTYYNSDDFYYREIKLNSDGDILETKKISPTSTARFENIIYDKIGNKYDFGGRLAVDLSTPNGNYVTLNASLSKHNPNNIHLFSNLYGFPFVEDYFYNAHIDNNNKITLIGKTGVFGDVNQRTRWIVQFDDFGNIVWEIKESSLLTEYYGRDIIQDDDGNYLSLFEDYNGYNIAVLMKCNNQGEILWKFVDGEANNNDNFSPRKIIQRGNEYSIFGKKGQKLWLKKITVN